MNTLKKYKRLYLYRKIYKYIKKLLHKLLGGRLQPLLICLPLCLIYLIFAMFLININEVNAKIKTQTKIQTKTLVKVPEKAKISTFVGSPIKIIDYYKIPEKAICVDDKPILIQQETVYRWIACIPQSYVSYFEKAAKDHDIWVVYLMGIANTETHFNNLAIGDSDRFGIKASYGIFQILLYYHPIVTKEMAMNIEFSTDWAAKYLNGLGFQNDFQKAIGRYNGGWATPNQYYYQKVQYAAIHYYSLY